MSFGRPGEFMLVHVCRLRVFIYVFNVPKACCARQYPVTVYGHQSGRSQNKKNGISQALMLWPTRVGVQSMRVHCVWVCCVCVCEGVLCVAVLCVGVLSMCKAYYHAQFLNIAFRHVSLSTHR